MRHSVPERADGTHWNGAVARSTDSSIRCATALDTASDPTSGLAQCRHPTPTDPLHHFNDLNSSRCVHTARRRHTPQRNKSACECGMEHAPAAHTPNSREGEKPELDHTGKMGSRWSSETQNFLCALAKTKAPSAPLV